MSASHASGLPDLAEVLGGLLERLPREQQPLLVAIAERLAARRYRSWAEEAASETQSAQLRACAAREEQIAGSVEALYPEAAALQRDILARNPDLEEVNRRLFAERPLAQQLALQARGERLGASTWRSFAKHAESSASREVFRACAELEEESAFVLEAILDAGG